MSQRHKINTGDALLGGSAHLFYSDIHISNIDSQRTISLLNQIDYERFRGIKNSNRQKQFLAGRILVKQVLHDLFKVPLEHAYRLHNYSEWIVYETNSSFYISISHSENIVVVAVSQKEGMIGVDVEQHKVRNFAELATMITTPKEWELFEKSNHKKQFFYGLWTAKEAYIKAFGLELMDISEIDLSACLLDKNDDSGWHFYQDTIEQQTFSVCLISDIQTASDIKKILIQD